MKPLKPATASAMGKKGGKARHPGKGMGSATPEERKERARVMVEARRAKRVERERAQEREGK